MGSMGKIFVFCRIKLKFCFNKPWSCKSVGQDREAGWGTMTRYMTLQNWEIFIMGVRENLCLLSDQAEILFLVI